MTPGFSEETVELAGIETLKSLGWLYLHGSVIAPDGPSPQVVPSPLPPPPGV